MEPLMNKTVIGIATLAASSLLCVSGAAIAAANVIDTPAGTVAATTQSTQQSTQSEAQQVQRSHDELQASAKANDVSRIRTELTQLTSVLANISTARSALKPETNAYLTTAQTQNFDLQEKLTQPGILDSLTSLLSNLLSTLQNLVGGLLGGLLGGGSSSSTPPSTPSTPAPSIPTAQALS